MKVYLKCDRCHTDYSVVCKGPAPLCVICGTIDGYRLKSDHQASPAEVAAYEAEIDDCARAMKGFSK